MSAFGLDYLINNYDRKKLFTLLSIFLIFFAGIFSTTIFGAKIFKIDLANLIIAKHNFYLPLLIFVSSGFLIFMFDFAKKRKLEKYLIAILILITVFDLFRFGWKFTPFTSQNYLFPNTKVLSFLENQNDKNFRIMTDDSRILPPNFSIMYHLQSVDGYDPLYLLRYGEFILALERGRPDISPPFGFNRIITPHNYNSPLLSLLNVKYLLTFSDIKSPNFNLVNQQGMTKVYAVKNYIPRVFFAQNLEYAQNKNEDIDLLFDKNFVPKKTAVVEKTNLTQKNYPTGSAKIISYSSNRIVIQTNNLGDGFLVLLDIYYPTWSATIDGKKTEIDLTDYTFRGIQVPAGKHTIEFDDNLL